MRMAIMGDDQAVLLGNDLKESIIFGLAGYPAVDHDIACEVVRVAFAREEQGLRKRTIGLGSRYARLRLAVVREVSIYADTGPRTRFEPLAYADAAGVLRMRLLLGLGLQTKMDRLTAMGVVHAFFDVEERRGLEVSV